MKHRRWLSLLLVGAMLLSSAAAFAGCTTDTPNTPPASDTDPATNTPDTPAPPKDPNELSADQPKLATLTLDDGTDLSFDPGYAAYSVTLPAGRPRVPRIAATAANADAKVTVYQPMFPDGVTETFARVDVELGGKSSSYVINFKKDASLGFHLQYDDRYTFTPAYTLQDGEAFTFASSNADAVTVNDEGLVQVKALSNAPITITAKVGEEIKDTLTIDKTVRAPLNIFLIVGQSNSAGTYDSGLPADQGSKATVRTAVGTVYCAEGMGKPYDMKRGRAGYAGALGQEWYALTGEKVMLIQTAVGGSAIERWEKNGDLYKGTVNAYNKLMKQYTAEDAKYEVVRTAYFWCQGETAQMWTWNNGSWDQSGKYIMTADDYYARFMKNHENFVKDMNVEFGTLLLVRAIAQVASRESLKTQYLTDLVAPRVAQYTIHNTTDSSIIIGSRIGEIARTSTAPDKDAPGYGYMGPENLHYSQIGYNEAGKELAQTSFYTISAAADRTPEKIDVLSSDGRTRLADGDTITVDVKNGYQLAAIVLPLYAKNANLSYEVIENADKCSVDMYGKVTFKDTAALGATAKIRIKSETGLTFTINAVLGEVEDEDVIKGKSVSYRWDFDNLIESNEYSNLTLSDRSSKDSYDFEDGCIVLKDSNTDFTLSQGFVLTQAQNWHIEWRGKAEDNSCLFGSEYSNNNFIYLAYNVPSFSNSFRMVDNSGTVAQIPFRSYKSKVTEMSTWRVEYEAESKKMTLYYKNEETGELEKVGTAKWSKDFTFYISNMFGRYNSDSVLVCYKGTVDYIFLSAMTED